MCGLGFRLFSNGLRTGLGHRLSKAHIGHCVFGEKSFCGSSITGRALRGVATRASGAMSQKRGLPDHDFPTTLEGFGYHFDAEGHLRQIENGEPYEYEVQKGDKEYNQARYEAIGRVLDEYVFDLLESRGGLRRVYIPVDAKDDDIRSFIFMSEDALTNPNKLMLLIHGTGVVRAGQWARRVIMNDTIDAGTQLPYIERAAKEGYGVIVLNTNLNKALTPDGDTKPVSGSESPEKHAAYVWDHFVKDAQAEKIAIVAHSYGGVVVVDLVDRLGVKAMEKVKAIAFTDSVHGSSDDAHVRKWMKTRACNWVQSDKPLDTVIRQARDCLLVSAGTDEHVYTSPMAFTSVFDFVAKHIDSELPSDGPSDHSPSDGHSDHSPSDGHSDHSPLKKD